MALAFFRRTRIIGWRELSQTAFLLTFDDDQIRRSPHSSAIRYEDIVRFELVRGHPVRWRMILPGQIEKEPIVGQFRTSKKCHKVVSELEKHGVLIDHERFPEYGTPKGKWILDAWYRLSYLGLFVHIVAFLSLIALTPQGGRHLGFGRIVICGFLSVIPSALVVRLTWVWKTTGSFSLFSKRAIRKE